ncbi:D-threo-aldose 1-dehydrogenase [Hamadaea flava]|uniref:Aldo/keto reductase n=1 Tax=Hamadaea flava TaxID=1742688 RepID=A0ABV8LVY6_9ACTN|nr:aldo/keto reductase [Hamadaea flava]MCP2327691.1 D-threo-aldose 1-dehydrogenase [Hamadaea flava]
MQVELGRTGLTVTRLGLGLAPIGGLYADVSEHQARQTVDRAWDRGIRLFDTAPFYGYGRSELRSGEALRDRGAHVLSTKVGRVLERQDDGDTDPDVWVGVDPTVRPVFDFSAAGVRRSFEDSLRRLGRDRMDVVHLHDPDDHLEQAVAEAYPELVRLRDEGLITAIGAGANSVEVLAYLVERVDLDVVLMAGRYTLLDRSGTDLLDRAADRGVAVIAAGVFNSGILADPQPGSTFNYAAADEELLNRALRLKRLAEEHGVPLRAAAVQFPLRHPAIAAVLVGLRSPEEVDDAADMIEAAVPDELWAVIA